MINLMTIFARLKDGMQQLTDEENLYLNQLGDEIRRAGSDAARWRILQREGLDRIDGFNLDRDVMEKLRKLQRAAMN